MTSNPPKRRRPLHGHGKRGFRVRSLSMLMNLAYNKRSVIGDHPVCRRPRPAAFIINMQAAIVHRLLKKGLYLYEKG